MLNENNNGLQGEHKISSQDNDTGSDTNRFDCKYLEIEEFQDKFSSLSNSFSTFSLNVRSLPGKWDSFIELITDLNSKQFNFSMICIQEVWNVPNYFKTDITGYKPIECKLRKNSGNLNNNIGGGVACWVKDSLDYELLDHLSIFEEKVFESLFIKVKVSKKKFKIIGNIYRPPNSDLRIFNEHLDTILNQIHSDKNLRKADEIQLVGDININLLNYTHPATSQYLDTLSSHGIRPLITLPSRITQTSATALDHINSNSMDEIKECGLIYSSLSDNLPVFCISKYNDKLKNETETHYVRHLSEQNKSSYKDKLRNYDWTSIMYEMNPEKAFSSFSLILDNIYEQSFPLKRFTPNKNKFPVNPWFTSALLNSRKEKEKLAKKKNTDPSLQNISNFKAYNTIYRLLVKKAKSNYFQDKFNEYSHDIKNTWSLINSLISN